MSDLEQLERDKKRLLDRLAIVVGLFGSRSRGWAEIEVEHLGKRQVMAASEDVNKKIQYARSVLKEFGREPMV